MSERLDFSDILSLPLKFAASLPCLRGNFFNSLLAQQGVLRVSEDGTTTYSYEGSINSVDYPSQAEEGDTIYVTVEEATVQSRPSGVSVQLMVFLKEVTNGRDQKHYRSKQVSAKGQAIEFPALKTEFPGEDTDYVIELVLQYAPGKRERWYMLDEFFFTVSKKSLLPFDLPLPFKLPF